MSLQKWIEKGVSYYMDRGQGAYGFLKLASSMFPEDVITAYKPHQEDYRRSVMQGIVNHQVITANPQGLWPYWVQQQLQPQAPGFQVLSAPPITINSTARNWTYLSYPYMDHFARVDPRGMITPNPNGWSLDFWLVIDGQIVTPARTDNVNQTMETDPPVIHTTLQYGTISLDVRYFFRGQTHLGPVTFASSRVKNNGDTAQSIGLLVAVRPYNTEGIAPIDSVVYHTDQAFIVNNRLSVIFDQKPHNVLCLRYLDGDILDFYHKWEMILQVTCDKHLASGFAEYRLELAPGQEKEFTYKIPHAISSKRLISFFHDALSPKAMEKLSGDIHTLQQLKPETVFEDIKKDWRNISKQFSLISTPSQKTDMRIQQSLINLFSMLNSRGMFQATEDLSASDHAHQLMHVRALNRYGFFDTAKKCLSRFYHLYNKPFQSLSLSERAEYCFALLDYHTFSQDSAFLSETFAFVSASIDRFFPQLEKEKPFPKALHLLTHRDLINEPIYADDDHVLHTLWAYVGAKSAVDIATILGQDDVLPRFKTEEEKITKYLNILLASVLKKPRPANSRHSELNPAYIPSLLGVYPLGIFNANDDIVKTLMKAIVPNIKDNEAYFQFKGHSGYATAANCQLAQIYLSQSHPDALTLFKWLLDVSQPTGSWPESVHPRSHGGISGEGQYALTNSEYLILARNMICHEDGQTLWITPQVPSTWIREKDDTIKVKGLPTRFGTIDFSLTNYSKKCILSLKHQFHTKPKEIRIRFPWDILKMQIGLAQKETMGNEAVIPLQTQKAEFILEPHDTQTGDASSTDD